MKTATYTTELKEPPPDVRRLEVVSVARHVIERDGWPRSWRQLRADAEASVINTLRDSQTVPDLCIEHRSRGELAYAAYQPLDRAYFRDGGDDRACLIAQAWMCVPR